MTTYRDNSLEPEEFVIRFGDPENMREARVTARLRIREGEAQLEEMKKIAARTQKWRKLDAFLTDWLGDDEQEAVQAAEPEGSSAANSPNGSGNSESAVALAVGVVNREVRKIRAKDVHSILQREGHNFDKAAVSNALYYAAKRAKQIQAASGRGMYAPLAYREDVIFNSTRGDAIE